MLKSAIPVSRTDRPLLPVTTQLVDAIRTFSAELLPKEHPVRTNAPAATLG